MSLRHSLNPMERAILKGQMGPYGGHISDWIRAGKYTPKIRFSKMNLQKTEKTVRVCRGCMGGRIQAIKHITGQITYRECSQCKGGGTVYG